MEEEGPQTGRIVAAVIGLLALAPVGFFYAASGLVVPGPWIFLLWLLFIGWLALAAWLVRRRSYWVLLVPVIAMGVWVTVLSLGERYAGWTG